MTVHPTLSRGRWYLGRDRFVVNESRYDSGPRRYKFNGYWSGAGWVRGRQTAIYFSSEAAAEAYIEGNYEAMSQASTATRNSYVTSR